MQSASFKDKMRALNKGKKKKSYAELAKIYGKNESSVYETVKKGEKIHASFAGTSQTAKVTATVHEARSASMEGA